MTFPVLVFVVLTTFTGLSTGHPLDLKNILDEDGSIDPKVSSWELIPIKELVANSPFEDGPAKNHARRESLSLDPNAIADSWTEDVPVIEQRSDRLFRDDKPIRNRLLKKDALVSRNWGAGGMPFSVLYMSPHSLRGNHASTASQQKEISKTSDASTPPAAHPNYRIALRNGSSTQPRRQYSIIPQLFGISYGWGPFGK